MDPTGRIWIGYTEPCRGLMGCWLRDQRKGVSVFSPEGDLVHDLRICQPEGGIAFANGYAFVGCWTKVYVVDIDTLAVVGRIEWEYPPDATKRAPYWGMTAIEEIDGSILIFVRGPPPDYRKLTNSSASVTSIGVIDPRTLTIRGYLNGLEPGLRISDAVEVDGKAWVFNELSHIKERPPRVDVYVVDPRTLKIVDRFNLDNPFPKWARRHSDGSIHIFHRASGERSRRAGFRSGITRLDPSTRAQEFVATPDRLGADGLDLYRGQACLAEAHGDDIALWCMDDGGRWNSESLTRRLRSCCSDPLFRDMKAGGFEYSCPPAPAPTSHQWTELRRETVLPQRASEWVGRMEQPAGFCQERDSVGQLFDEFLPQARWCSSTELST